MIIYGLVFTLKHFGWPSDTERKNKIIRAVRTGFSSTALGVGLMLMYFYWTSPETFWSQLTLATSIGAFFFLVIPIFGVMTVASYIQFSVWEKTQSTMTSRLKKIIDDSNKDDKKIK
jgi:hypothetical protein